MTVSDLVSISGYSRQRINQLVDLGHAHGIERKPNRRLEVTDRPLAKRWCEFLRKRKETRRQNNLARKEWRDRLKIRRTVFAVDLPAIIGEVFPFVTAEVRASLKKKFGFSESDWNKLAEEISRESVQAIMRPVDFYRMRFAMRGRKTATKAARRALFDWLAAQVPAYWYRGYADIARDFGCTRAAVSAAGKQLPPELLKRSGRFLRAATACAK
jgi:hypothetical protein